VKIEGSGADRAMVIQPKAATSAGDTHAPLVLGPNIPGDVDFTVRMKTDAQLRKNSAPNPWEVGWVLWDYADDTHFYSLVLKPNGWELGKQDPAYKGAQRFLATGSTPAFPIGKWYTVRITRTGNVLNAYVDGSLLTTFTDTERPYSSGRIALYNEDAITRFDDVIIGNKGVTSAVSVTAAGASIRAMAAVANAPVVMERAAQPAPATLKKRTHRHRRYSLRKIARTVVYSRR